MEQQKTLESLSDRELMAARLELESQLHRAQQSLQAVEQETYKRVQELYKENDAKNQKEQKEQGIKKLSLEELQDVLKAIKDKKETTQRNADTPGLE